ncbi:MAG: O-antigen ligase family protein [Gammaproteobacteria bacterium]|nr:MAG: O-antigen ligase family protein [Gammaproteobacteria bacterium]
MARDRVPARRPVVDTRAGAAPAGRRPRPALAAGPCDPQQHAQLPEPVARRPRHPPGGPADTGVPALLLPDVAARQQQAAHQAAGAGAHRGRRVPGRLWLAHDARRTRARDVHRQAGPGGGHGHVHQPQSPGGLPGNVSRGWRRPDAGRALEYPCDRLARQCAPAVADPAWQQGAREARARGHGHGPRAHALAYGQHCVLRKPHGRRLIDLLVVGNFFGLEKVAERIQQTSTEPGDRIDTDRDALAMLRDFPLTGIGAGAFYAVYPMYTSAVVVTGFTRHAHDDYLQFACEFGLFFAAVLGAVVLASLWTAIRAQLRRRDQQLQGMGFAATMAIVALLIHSAVDFNLQIPANAAMFVVMLALGWVSRYWDPLIDLPAHH